MHKIQASTDLIHTFSHLLEIGPPGLDTNITLIVDIAVMHWRAARSLSLVPRPHLS